MRACHASIRPDERLQKIRPKDAATTSDVQHSKHPTIMTARLRVRHNAIPETDAPDKHKAARPPRD